MAEIKNTFLKGKMNQDLDPRIMPNGEYRKAQNLAISRSEGSTVGEFENILGNVKISDLSLSTGSNDPNIEIIGYTVDESNNIGYFIATNNTDHYIFSVNLSTGLQAPTILVQGSFLNFNKDYIITGINLIEDFLFWTDNYNQPRKINVTKPLGHYTNEDQISVAKYAPYKPILVMDRFQTSLTVAVSNSSTIVVADSSGVKVGDIVTEKDKLATQQITGLVVVIGKPATNTLTLSSSVTISNGTKLDFSRSSMTNKSSKYMSNRSSGNATITGTFPNKTYQIKGASTADTEFLYNGNNGIPKIGDLVTSTVSGIPAGTRVASVSVVDNTGAFQSITVTLDKDTTFPPNTTPFISISDNPDYDINWKGDSEWLDDKFVRFSYRFKFEDNEYSLMAPFSQPMFIPRNYSEFGSGLDSVTDDMDNAYKSTIISWFENNIDNILLKIPTPDGNANYTQLINNLHLSEIDILYKESDALAVKVLDTLNITPSTTVLPSIAYDDFIHGDISQYYVEYNYTSNKPYKTLPQNQTTRVSDKVPVKALGQEVIGNRIVYGNYLDKHSSPNKIAFSATTQNKDTRYDNYTQFPKHTLKQNRTYQVGFVLSDRYGRQSDVILSSYDDVSSIPGSTVFHPYNTLDRQTTDPVIQWLGDVLSVQLNETIGESGSSQDGNPGVYSASNPLGWYSYKIVVKQQEQEYYNVYLPGFINGYPVTQQVDTNKLFFTTLISDNINKIPRNLKEVGPSDNEYNSDEIITIRVNNPIINNKPQASYRKDIPWNAQYYPNNISQNVLSIATVRDMEIQAIPFKPAIAAGEYGESKILSTYTYNNNDPAQGIDTVNEVPEPTGAIPWGTTGPDPSIYDGESNPLVVKISSTENGNNSIGARVFTTSVYDSSNNNQLSMIPFLSIAETKPVYSVLDIFWETSLSGNLITLNSLIDSQYGGLVSANFTAATFPESINSEQTIGNNFDFITGSGSVAAGGSITINSLNITAPNQTVPDDTFSVSLNSSTNRFQVKSNANARFAYNSNSSVNDVYTITVNVTYNDGSGTYTDDIILNNISLTNIAPRNINCSNPTGLNNTSTIIKNFTVDDNGSADTSGTPAINTLNLLWSKVSNGTKTVNGVTTDLDAGFFEFSNTVPGRLQIGGGYSLTNEVTYNVTVKVSDLNGVGSDSLSTQCAIQFTTGIPNVPVAICRGNQRTPDTVNCAESIEYQFLASNIAGATGSYPTGYNQSGTIYYNVSDQAPSDVQPVSTGALTQGVMYINTSFRNTSTTATSEIIYTIQYRSDANSSWTQATKSTGGTVALSENLSSDNNITDTDSFTFNLEGEYRLITQRISGSGCSSGNSFFNVTFGDDTYGNTNCPTPP
tara:strand:+ start:134 stop:4210 length:4077 start_codon:yes stop_codon:yes gene_type:complete